MEQRHTICFTRIESPVGLLTLAASDRALCGLHFHGHIPAPAKGEVWVEDRERLRMYEEALMKYFRGELKEFSFPLDLRGTPFQIRCWEALRKIPYGQTCSYADIAREICSPRAFRAVGQANHNNPIAIVVPCHRVVGSGGSLTGYGGGLEIKEQLLRLERNTAAQQLQFPMSAAV
ncbi:MAG TPA: methylated-DNA--[protein]-cysteine S-methyltransferase [Candidatus Limnocylindrales bacterium]|jgi:methylated-DNA-[protein]-cysteine S-methyltransferase|nr:methylated-DNA--[protein]-cysteine S-methyltransferase [Candidatus Limnocylindrales bacterium]